MPDFVVHTEQKPDVLYVHARRADGAVKELDIPIAFLQRWRIAKEIITFLTEGENERIPG
jgi:hypothetical protein